MAFRANRIDIGPFRNVRINHKPNKGGYWEVWWTDARGRSGYETKIESLHTKIRAEAEVRFRQFCDDIKAHTLSAAAQAAQQQVNQLTIEELCQGWLDHIEDRGISAAKTGRAVLNVIRRELGDMKLGQLTDGALLKAYHRRRRGIDGVTDSTVRREIAALQTVCLWAARQRPRLIDMNDLPAFADLIPPQGKPRERFLDRGQEGVFWDAAMDWAKTHSPKGWRISVFVALGLDTAARRGAICDLTWDRVDLVQGRINFVPPTRRDTPTKRRVKGLTISDRLMPVLKEAWLQAPKTAGQAIGPVLGSGVTPDVMAQAFRKFTAEIGMPWVTPHVLRHTYASLAAMAGVPLYDIARVMGDTIATVERSYLHLTPGHLAAAVNFRNKV